MADPGSPGVVCHSGPWQRHGVTRIGTDKQGLPRFTTGYSTQGVRTDDPRLFSMCIFKAPVTLSRIWRRNATDRRSWLLRFDPGKSVDLRGKSVVDPQALFVPGCVKLFETSG